jgi:hypothetical protein
MAFLMIPLRIFCRICEGAGPLKQEPDGPSKHLSRQPPRLDDGQPDRSAMKPHDHKAIQQFEANGRDHEQIHGGNVRSVIAQKVFHP